MLSPKEIQAAFEADGWGKAYRPILTVAEVADLCRVSRKTVYYWISQGRLRGCFRKRGNHVLLWRDRVVDRIFNGAEWPSEKENNQ